MASKLAPKLGVPVHHGALVVTDENPDDYHGDSYVPAIQAPEQAPEEAGLLRRVVGDSAVTAIKGAIGVPEAAVGLADIVTGGHVGKALENEGGAFGFRPKVAREYLDTLYSPQQRAAFKAVQTAANPADSLGQRILDTGFAAIKNPSTIVHAVGESIPAMLAGGVVGRGVMAGAASMTPSIVAAEAAPLVASPGARAALSNAQIAAAGIGEGVVSGAQTAEQIRQETKSGLLTPKQVAVATNSGALTAGIGVIAGRAARSLGVGDIDTLVAGGNSSERSS